MNRVEIQAASAHAMDLAVGRRIRELRRARDLPLTAVAERTGLSIGFLSQIERGLSSPSLRVLANLADTFGVALGALFGAADGEADPVVVRGAERPELKLWRSGISKQLLTPPAPDSRLNLYLVRMEPEASTGDEFYTHQGEEAGLVLEGTMILTVDTDQYRLERGDSFRFASTRPHRFSNPLRQPTLVAWINSLA